MKFAYLALMGAVLVPMALACGGAAGKAYCDSFATSFMESCQDECAKRQDMATCTNECLGNLESAMSMQGCEMPASFTPPPAPPAAPPAAPPQ